jgi:ketosteroid isomerase-like protein
MTSHAPSHDEVRSEILDLEDKRFAAMTNRDFPALDELLDERLCYTHSSGVRDTKEEYLDAVREHVYVYGPVSHAETQITVVGDVAIVTGEMSADIIVRGNPKKLSNASTAVWARSADRWRLLTYQTTPLPSAV